MGSRDDPQEAARSREDAGLLQSISGCAGRVKQPAQHDFPGAGFQMVFCQLLVPVLVLCRRTDGACNSPASYSRVAQHTVLTVEGHIGWILNGGRTLRGKPMAPPPFLPTFITSKANQVSYRSVWLGLAASNQVAERTGPVPSPPRLLFGTSVGTSELPFPSGRWLA